MSNSGVLLSLEFSLLVLGMTVPDIFLLAVEMGRFVELVDLLTGMIKPAEDTLPKNIPDQAATVVSCPGSKESSRLFLLRLFCLEMFRH